VFLFKGRLFVSHRPVKLMASLGRAGGSFARVLPFLIPYLVPLSVVICYEHWGLRAFAIVAGVYLAAPLLDLLLGRDKGAQTPSPVRTRPESLLCRLALWFWAPTQAAFIVWALVVVTRENLGALDCWALACSLGLTRCSGQPPSSRLESLVARRSLRTA
jgi:hypothetical protein